MRAAIVLAALLLVGCNHDYGGGGYGVDDGSFKRPPTPIPAVPAYDIDPIDQGRHAGDVAA